MESRKMELTNLFAEQQQRDAHREQTLDKAGEGECGQIERVAWKYMHYHMENRQSVGIYYITQGAQFGAA